MRRTLICGNALKDLRLATGTAYGPRLGLTKAARDWLEEAAVEGAADLDISAVVATIRAAAHTPDGAHFKATAP